MCDKMENNKPFFNKAFEYARKYSTCRKVYVGALFKRFSDEKEFYSCNRTDDLEKNCQIIGDCYKYKATGIYESCEETRPYCSAVHSEINIIKKLKDEFVDPSDGILFVTRYPCINCAKNLVENGFKYIYYCGRQEISEEVEELFKSNNISYRWYPEFDYESEDNKIWWTIGLYNKAYNIVKDRKFPIVIPSYNRPNPAILKTFLNESNMDDDFNYPIFVFVRDSQKEMYEKAINNKFVTIISFPDNIINDAGKVRRMITKWLYSKGYNCAFSFDDDLVGINFTQKAYTGKGDLKAGAVRDTNIAKVLAMWQLAMEKAVDKYGVLISGLMPQFISWKPEYCFKEQSILLYRGIPSQAVCINVKGLVDNDLNYRSNEECGHEDIDLNIRILDKKLPICVFPFLAYSANEMSVENWDFPSMFDRFKCQQDKMKKNFSEIDWVKFVDEKRGLPQVTINWRRCRKYVGIEGKDYIQDIFEGEYL